MNILLIILVFGVIVFFHEFGHFIVAKLNHVAVTEFSIGLGPAIFSIQRKETKYSLRLLPLGGYCMMLGADEDSDDENAFNNKPVWVRILVIAAGPAFNFLLAFILGIVLIHFAGCDPGRLDEIADNGAAKEAGLSVGDTIKAINGKKIYNFRELQLFLDLDKKGEAFDLTLERPDGSTYTAHITPKRNQNGEYKIGVTSYNVEAKGIGQTLKYAALEIRYWTRATITSLRLIVTRKVDSSEIMGPVGVGDAMNEIIDEVKEESETTKEAVLTILLNLMNWCILLSVNLGIMNLIPIPALDGGRLLFLIIEAIRRKKISQKKEIIVNVIGFVIVLLLMVVIFFNDIKNIFL